MSEIDPQTAFASFDDLPPMKVDVECTSCRTTRSIAVGLLLRIDDESLADPWLLRDIYTCPDCHVVDEYEVSPASSRRAQRESRYVRVSPFLHDGSRFDRPSRALSHLRQLAARRDDADVWQRLGNTCSVYGLEEEAREAWRTALDRDENDFEVIFRLLMSLWEDHDSAHGAEVFDLLVRGVCLLPSLDRGRSDRLEVARLFLSYMAAVNWDGAAMTATWHDPDHHVRRSPEVVVHMSSVRMSRIGSWDALARFLLETPLISVGIHDDDDVDTHTDLEHLLSRAPRDESAWVDRALTELGSALTNRPSGNGPGTASKQTTKRRSKTKQARRARRKNRTK